MCLGVVFPAFAGVFVVNLSVSSRLVFYLYLWFANYLFGSVFCRVAQAHTCIIYVSVILFVVMYYCSYFSY